MPGPPRRGAIMESRAGYDAEKRDCRDSRPIGDHPTIQPSTLAVPRGFPAPAGARAVVGHVGVPFPFGAARPGIASDACACRAHPRAVRVMAFGPELRPGGAAV